MDELRDTLERRMDEVEFRPLTIERIYANRDRRRRNQRLRAGIVAAAVSMIAAVALLRALPWEATPLDTPPSPTQDPSPQLDAALPPPDADRSMPVVGEQLVYLYGSEEQGFPELFVYADGRIMRPTDGDWTSWEEQRLTPAGAALLREEILATGLFDHQRRLDAGSHAKLVIEARNERGDLVLVGTYGDLGPRDDWPKETMAQAEALAHLEEILVDPIAWLPEDVVEDPEGRQFVASRYFVEFSFPLGSMFTPPRPSDLPAPIDTLLREADERASWGACRLLTPAQARGVVEDLHRVLGGRGDTLTFVENGDHPYSVTVRPALPHETSCA